MTNRPWTNTDLKVIRKTYSKYGPEWVAKRLDRSLGSIYVKAHMLGLTNPRPRKATPRAQPQYTENTSPSQATAVASDNFVYVMYIG